MNLNYQTELSALKQSIQKLSYRGNNTLTADEFLELLKQNPKRHALDVRSEGEFEKGSFPQTKNIPLLRNSERHDVGITYKALGQESAIQMGLTQVLPNKSQRVKLFTETNPLALFCWRGGLRSKISQAWVAEVGSQVPRVVGGYKAIRSVLLKQFENLPQIFVLSGATGSGKTEFLNRIRTEFRIDLEALANHKGSSFGRPLKGKQPSQSTFENALGFALFCHEKSHPLFLEDESLAIGSVFLPKAVKDKMRGAPTLLLEESVETRAQNIFTDYVIKPMCEGFTKSFLLAHYQEALLRIRSKLGNQEFKRINELITSAFEVPTGVPNGAPIAAAKIANETSFEKHSPWITALLEKYYDPLYRYSLEKKNSATLVFKGDRTACRQWIQTQFALLKPFKREDALQSFPQVS